MRVYITGPMTGLPDYNYPAFNNAAARWRAAKLFRPFGVVVTPEQLLVEYRAGIDHPASAYQKIEVSNPAENFNGIQNLDYSTYLKQAFIDVLNVDALAVLPGAYKSNGAMKEIIVAQTIGLKFYDATSMHEIYIPKLKVCGG